MQSKLKSSFHRTMMHTVCCGLALAVAMGSSPALLGAQGAGEMEAKVAVTAPARVLARSNEGIPTFLVGELGRMNGLRQSSSQDLGLAARQFLQPLLASTFGGRGSESMVRPRVIKDSLGRIHIRLDQEIHGLPVVGAQLIVHADGNTGRVFAMNGSFLPDDGVDQEPALKASDALGIALAAQSLVDAVELRGEPVLVYVLGSDARLHLAWRSKMEIMDPENAGIDFVFADAMSGEFLTSYALTHSAKAWKTHDAMNLWVFPGTLACTNNQLCGATVLQTIHDHTSLVYDYYFARHGRDSFDDAGAEVLSTGHFRNNYNNAQWCNDLSGWCSNSMGILYGDGDGTSFGYFGDSLDIVAHETTHGVIDFGSQLIYSGQSGALNEGWADIFGAAAEAWVDGGITTDTWKIGENTATPFVAGDALRYMNDPTLDGFSADYYPTRVYPEPCTPVPSNDRCGVHYNSGIANLAFYLLVSGGSHPRGATSTVVSGIGMQKAEAIFYRAQTTYLTPSADFQAARLATAQAAADIYGVGTSEVESVHAAWCAVGVPGCPLPNQSPVANDDLVFIPVGASSFGVSFGQLLANDTDPNGDPLFVVAGSFGQPSCGILIEQAGQVVYTPGQAFWDGCSESFAYGISDRAPGNGGLTDTATVTLQAAAETPIFADGFESNSTSAWSGSGATGGGSVLTTSGAALVERYGLSAEVSGGGKAYVRDDSPNDEVRYRARFHLDSTGMAMGAFDAHAIFNAYDGSGTPVLALSLRSGQLVQEISAGVLKDDGTWAATGWIAVLGSAYVEISWVAASGPAAGDGEVRLWVGGSDVTVTGLDTDQRRIDSIRLGVVGGVDAATTGNHKIDAFESRRWTRIGPAL